MVSRRRNPSLLTAMILVAVFAAGFGWLAAERRKRVESLTLELRRREERVRWAEKMQRQGYASRAKLAVDVKNLHEVESELSRLGASVKNP